MNFRHIFNKTLKTRIPKNPRGFYSNPTITRKLYPGPDPNPTRTQLLLPEYITTLSISIKLAILYTTFQGIEAWAHISNQFYILKSCHHSKITYITNYPTIKTSISSTKGQHLILKIYNAIYGIYINLYPPLNLINSDQSLYYSCNLFKLIELEGLLLVYYIVPCISYDTTTIYIIHLYFTIYWTLN